MMKRADLMVLLQQSSQKLPHQEAIKTQLLSAVIQQYIKPVVML
jgi:hypothetical protein